MLFSLFISIVAFLLGTASAYPTEDPVTQVPGNDTKIPSDFYDASIQVLLNRASGTEYYWEMFQGPSGKLFSPVPILIRSNLPPSMAPTITGETPSTIPRVLLL